MAEILGRWAGHLYGTNTGNLFVEFEGVATELRGTVRLMDNAFGLNIFAATGSFVDGRLALQCEIIQAPEGLEFGAVSVTAALAPDGVLRGDWRSTLGTAGTLVLHPHGDASTAQIGPRPERLHVAAREFGALSLGSEGVRALIQAMNLDMGSQPVVVTYPEGGLEISRFAADFERDIQTLGIVYSLRLNVQSLEPSGVNRVVSVEISRYGINQVRVQGTDGVWVRGKMELVADLLGRHERRMLTGVRKWGLNFNTLLVVAAVIAMPDLPLTRRAIFAAAIFALILSIAALHKKFVPGAVIRLSPMKSGFIERAGPQVLSWLIAASSAVVASVVYGLLKGELKWWEWQ